ncbi:thiopeptide-type bacteriocin biosynthesis protein [Actinocorallia sp. API 0066]|uniref:thiopeptide-type bacteriocin biosynthesis protein n=1 Tax=Actinocorallia sp. API 0066 TaxID=2896846 RepID=UPI001E29D019|nr:thiopeptide-type bacteriocin biosynthesis protein [Actinocorallia sp. API 0066]MCD0449054.1 thiopeptide-type bacteriocin biosynthesis protein [Actinocorallia sp. API 0066]
MPPHHLTTKADHVGQAVRAVLSGADLAATAAAHDLHPADLDEATALYHAAGTAALVQTADTWLQVMVHWTDWASAETVGAHRLGPRLDDLVARGRVGGWWFLRKHPCWRVRLHEADQDAVAMVLDELADDGILRWRRTLYEPETVAFGGTGATDIVHDLFCGDSAGALDYLRHPALDLGRREVSLLLLNGLLQAAKLDAFERGDVFARIARMRPAPPPEADLATLTGHARTLLSIPDLPTSPLFTAGGPADHAAPWLAAHTRAGRRLAEAASDGRLERGLRAILSHIVIFHWNRLGLSAERQGVLAHAATAALLPD